MSTEEEEKVLQDEADELRKEQERLLAEQAELESSSKEVLDQETSDLSETKRLLQTIKEDIQGIHSENEQLKQEVDALGAENNLLKQAVNLPEGEEGQEVLKNTIAGLESLSGQRPSSTGSNVIWQKDVTNQREELRGEREELMTERNRLRAEASRLAGDLQTNIKEKFPANEATIFSRYGGPHSFQMEPPEGVLEGVLEEYGALCGEQGDLQAEHERLKRELEEIQADQPLPDPAQEKRERDQLRRELTASMIRYSFFPPKPEIPAPQRRESVEVKENNQYLKFKTKNMLGQLLKPHKPTL